MKGRYIQLQGNKKNPAYMFDRKQLIEGYTNTGKYIPEGGVILGNGNLAGYVLSQTGGNRNWSIIGKVDNYDPNLKYIPSHQNETINIKNTQVNKSEKQVDKPVSLKTAVKMLREYYRNNFN